MSSRIDPSLYPRLHEQLADRFGTVVFKLLPDIADALLAHAAEGLDANVAAKLTDTARLLREEAAVRAEIALENFVGIDLGSMSEESSLPVTVTDLGQPVAGADIGLLEQILARELASTVRSSFGGSYLNYLRRLESLAETPLRDDQHPLGARALALALIMALKPFWPRPSSRWPACWPTAMPRCVARAFCPPSRGPACRSPRPRTAASGRSRMSRLQLLQNTENPILVSFQPKTFETALYSTPRTRC